jgi:hypothetical protein
MSIPSPNLDDRSFQQLLDESILRIKQSCPKWSDLSPGDPGMALLELFAFLTDTMIYRLNRVPEKMYVEFLKLLGTRLLPPAASCARLRFSVKKPAAKPIEIPRGTRVTIARSATGKEPPVFVVAKDALIPAGQTETTVLAYHAEWVREELSAKASGETGFAFTVKRPPIVARLPDGFDLSVGVEALAGEIDGRASAHRYGEKTFRTWQEVQNFTDLESDRFVYVVDRTAGLIRFAPALYPKGPMDQLSRAPVALAEVAPAGREIRVSYLRGGGVEGDVAANTLTVIKDAIPGVEVTNPEPATGGSAAETLANALLRGPMELHTLERAVTARDFEVIALQHSGAVARARAFTKAALWKHATPGTVELLLVPSFPRLEENGWRVTPAQLVERQTAEARGRISQILDRCRPLGTICLVNWVQFKTVKVKARIVCHREEQPDQVKARVLRRLYQTINPLPSTPGTKGWQFGQSLRAFHVYDIILAEPGVKYVDQVRLLLDEVPDREITALMADASQPDAWYAAGGERLFRSVNQADGWELSKSFAGEKIKAIRVHRNLPGHVAIATESMGGAPAGHVWLSADCGESWRHATQLPFSIDDLAWVNRVGAISLVLATEKGLYELAAHEDAVPIQITVDEKTADQGFYAVAVSMNRQGMANVAVAGRENTGVWLSNDGRDRTFKHIGLRDEFVRTLETQEDGPRRWLWAGVLSPGLEEGNGCFRWELDERNQVDNPAEHWKAYNRGWVGSSCQGLTFFGPNVVAGTHHAGVLWTDSTRDPAEVSWNKADVNCGLPLREVDQFQPVDAVAVSPDGKWLLAGGVDGIYRSNDGGQHYQPASKSEFVDKVSLPATWLFCSGEHEIESVNEDETGAN